MNYLLKVAWRAKHVAGIPPTTVMEAFSRLRWAAARQPRRGPGEFRFPFGVVHHVDTLSLTGQYWQIFVQQVYDFESEHDEPVILDCGGNIGLSAIWFKKRYPKSSVTVFEADPAITKVLRRNLTSLGVADVRVVEAAVWVETGQVPFRAEGADTGRIDSVDGWHLVDAVRLADFVKEPVDLLKLDVEGAEYAVISDLCATGTIGHVKRLICEVHGRQPEKELLGALLGQLADHGLSYTLRDAHYAPGLPGACEPTPFPFARDGKFLANLYAWQPSLGS